MGYYSNVAIALNKKLLTEDLLKTKTLSTLFKETEPAYKNESAVYWEWEYIKWYESDKKIGSILAYLNDLDETDFGFIRIGENDTDIEFLGHPWDFGLQTERWISKPY